jgi:hypothetical protein
MSQKYWASLIFRCCRSPERISPVDKYSVAFGDPSPIDRAVSAYRSGFFEFRFFEAGEWWGETRTEARRFTRQDDGSYVGDAGGSPIWFRCVEQPQDYFIHVDGTGERFVYRLLALE